jgi:AmmeMemoRadiSam system protein B
MDKTTDLRPSPIAGQWYLGNATRLAESVDAFIEAAITPAIQGEVIAVIAPHAGHIYSGPVAGYAFAAVQGLKPDLVAIISPMHQPYPEPLLTSGHQAYQTPLGAIQIDRQAVQELNSLLESKLGFGTTPVRQDREHSLEIELPFLQQALDGEFSLLPVMVRDQSVRVTRALGLSLADVLKARNALLVASTDLSHFYPQEVANKLDKEMLRRIESFDPEAVLRAEAEGAGFACGRGAVAAVLWAARELGGDTVQILNHATSGDITGDYHQVVGYGAVVIIRKGNNTGKSELG